MNTTAGGILNRLHVKVMLLLVLVAVVPLGVVSVFSIRMADDLITSMVTNELESVADDKVALLERWITERRADLQVVAGSSILQSMDPKQIAPYIKLVGDKYQVYEGFVVASNDGSIAYDSTGMCRNCAKDEWFKNSLSGELCLSDITIESEGKESVFYIAAPIIDPKNEVIGVVRATVGTSAILSIVLKVSLGKTGESYLVDKEGTFLAHKEPRRILTENIAQSESFKFIFGKEERRKIYTDYRGIEVLGASRSVAGTEWYLVVEQDRDEAFEQADNLKRYAYIVFAISILGAIVLAWLLAYYITTPIRELNQAAGALAKGKFEEAVVKSKRTDEIGALYGAFSGMAKQLEERQISLEEKVDITEAELKETGVKLKMTEDAAVRSQQLAALGQLAAGVTHEIRTPLASIKLFLQSVRGEIEISPEYEQDFQIALQQVSRIEATINRFLDFARPQEPIFSTIDVGKLIEEALLVVKPRANQQEVVVNKKTGADLPEVSGDKRQLSEVLLNLMINALDSMDGKGVLKVEATCCTSNEKESPAEFIRIDVSDSGSGIDEENLGKVFDPFYTTKASGTGLGLAIVQSTVQRHGGTIKVESKSGTGTTFQVFIPAIKQDDRNGKNTDS